MQNTTGFFSKVSEDFAAEVSNAAAPIVRVGRLFVSTASPQGEVVVIVQGMANNTDSLMLSLYSADIKLLADQHVNLGPETLAWEFEAVLPAFLPNDPLRVYITTGDNSFIENVLVQLSPVPAEVPFGILANTDITELDYSAGSPDRFVERLTFATLDRTFFRDFYIAGLVIASGRNRISEIQMADVRNKLVISIQVPPLTALIKKALRSSWARLPGEPLKKVKAAAHASLLKGLRAHSKKTALSDPGNSDGGGILRLHMPADLFRGDWPAGDEDYLDRVIDALGKLSDNSVQLGIMFNDRIRMREVGVVRSKDVFYSLGLDANEEAQVTINSSTLRKRSVEDVVTKEVEGELELSSQWSNDLSFGVDLTSGATQGWNIGGNVGGQIPKIPITGGLSGGYNASTSSSESTSFAVGTAHTFLQRIAARMRDEHKVTIREDSEKSYYRGIVKTISNRSSQRPRRIEYRKLYKKLFVSYERHDASLCLRLRVSDPSQAIRARFLAQVGKFDPANPISGDERTPPDQAEKQIVRVTWTRSNESPTYVFNWDHHENIEVNIKTGPGADNQIPEDWLLNETPRLRVKKFTYTGTTVVSVQTNTVTLGARNEERAEKGVSYPSQFIGPNSVAWNTSWFPRQPDGHGEIRLAYSHFLAPYAYGYSLDSVDFEIESTWIPANADIPAYDAQRRELQESLASQLKYEYLTQLRNHAVRDFFPAVIDRAFRQWGPVQWTQLSATSLSELFDLENARIETAPYWASIEGRGAYNTVWNTLSGLPLSFPISDILVNELVASESILYLPVQHGREEDVLDLIAHDDDSEPTVIANDLNAFRRERFGPADTGPPLSSEQILSPGGICPTPHGATEWKNDWEKPQRKFDVLGHWTEYVPMDGADSETVLSQTSATDEAYFQPDRDRR